MRVDFYVTNDTRSEAPWLLACRLLEKAYLRGHRVFVFCNNQQDAEYLDELLWTFKDDSFIPHNLQGEGPEPPPPIQLGYSVEPRAYNDILFNMATEIPSFCSRFKRIIEIITENDAAKTTGRLHYRHYRAQQWDLHTHTLDAQSKT